MSTQPTSVFSRELLPASIAIFTTSTLISLQWMGTAAALPEIAGDLGNVSLLPWTITVYLLTSGLATVVAGPFIDAIGVRTMFRIAVIVFMVLGFAAAFSSSMGILIALRALQGIGAGLILSSGNAAVALVYPQHLVARAFAANATVWGVMGVAGPAVAAWILTFLSWHWIFYLNLPFGLLALAAGWRVLPGPFGTSEGRTDLRGPVLVAVVIVSLLFAVGALDVVSAACFALAVAAAIAYVWHARRSDVPVVKLEHLAVQPYSGLALSTGFPVGRHDCHEHLHPALRAGGTRRIAGPDCMVGYSPDRGLDGWCGSLEPGWRTGTASRRSSYSGSWRISRRSPSRSCWSNSTPHCGRSSVGSLGPGVGVGMSTNAAVTLMRAVTDPANMGRVGSAHLFGRNMGFTFGAAIGGAVLLLVVTTQLGDVELVRDLLSSSGRQAPTSASAAVQDGFAANVAVGLVLSGFGWLSAMRLRRSLVSAGGVRRQH